MTLRQLGTDAVIEVAVASDLGGIEWAADAHVPPDRPEVADLVRVRCAEAGVEVASYGSYVWARARADDRGWIGGDDDWRSSMTTARALGAPSIRVWAGTRASADTDPSGRAEVVAQLRDWAEAGHDHGLRVAVERHVGTLTDTARSASSLLADVDHPNLFAYWQPPTDLTTPGKLADVDAFATTGRLSNVHVFSWAADHARLPLADGADYWPGALDRIARAPAPDDRWALLEFVAEDDPARLREDAVTLHRWLGAESSP